MNRIKPWIYFAGKVSKNCWRHTLVPELRAAETGVPIEMTEFAYCGPYFISCDHGCAHYDGTHAMGEPRCGSGDDLQHPVEPADVPQLCQQWLRRSHLVFAWIDQSDCHGTLVELGWAQMLNIPVYVAFANEAFKKEMWFLTQCANTRSRVHADPKSALARALTLYEAD